MKKKMESYRMELKNSIQKMPKKNYLFHKKKIISSRGFQTILNSV